MRVIFFLFLTLGGVCTVVFAQDYRINSTTSYDQTDPAAAMDSQGSSIVVWSSYLQDGDSGGIFAQRFDANHSPFGSEFQINSIALGNQTEPAVAMAPAGNFIVVWHGPGDSTEDIFARRFNADGNPSGGQFRVNSNTAGEQMFPNVAAGGNGNSIIVWQSRAAPSLEQWNICFQLYDANDSPIGTEQQANLHTDSRFPDVAMDDTGRFTIVWMQDDSLHTYNQVMFRLYNSDGASIADPNYINTTPFYALTHPSISCAANGHFVVAWEAHPSAAALNDIYARWCKWDGSPKSDEFVVNTYTDGAQQYPKVAMDDNRNFLIAWNTETASGSNGTDIHARRFKTSDNFVASVGDEFTVNIYTFNDQKYPAALLRENGDFLIAWQSLGQDGAGYGIFAAAGPQIPCADFTDDVFVNFLDYCFLASEWLMQADLLTADLINDNKIDYYDLDAFSNQWLTPCYDCICVDINSDDAIDSKDFALLANNWLVQGPNLQGDIDANGCVNTTDLKILLTYWLELCP